MEQRTPEWHSIRCGKVTASRIADLMARTQKGWGASREAYLAQLVTERLTGAAPEAYTNASMAWGVEQEASARDCYAFEKGLSVVEEGFVLHPTIAQAGASPDGLVGNDGLVEIKCPNTATHIATLRGGAIPDKYIKQMQFQMACTERAWCDFVSYDPRLPIEMQLHVTRVPCDPEMIAQIEQAVTDFLVEVDAAVDELTSLYRKAA
jgi:putative phage-type endonuclease